MYVPLSIAEHDEPLLRFRARTLLRDRRYQVIDLSTVSAIKWLSKRNSKVSDASGIELDGVVVPPPVAGIFTVQIPASVTAVAGKYVYKIYIVVNGHPSTLQYGPLQVVST